MKPILLILGLLFIEHSLAAPAKQPTMAVLPFQLSSVIDTTNIGDLAITRSLTEQEFSDQLIQFLTKSRKFNLLTRSQVNKIMAENRLTESDWAEPGQFELMGKLLVADYLVTGTINRFETNAINSNIVITGETTPRLVTTFKSQFQVIESSTGKIVLADQIISKFKLSDIRREIPSSERKYWTSADYKDLIFTKISTEMGNAILSGIYPIKLIKVLNNEVILNRGKGAGLEIGSQCIVFSLGEAMIDTDTGESLGGFGSQVGLIEVTSIEGKFSKAKIISSSQSMQAGNVCKPQKKQVQKDEAAAYPRVTPGW